MRRFLTPAIVTVLMVAIPESAAPPPPRAQLAEVFLGSSRAMASAARTFLDMLTPELKTMAQLPFDSDERMNWHYIPRQRQEIPLK